MAENSSNPVTGATSTSTGTSNASNASSANSSSTANTRTDSGSSANDALESDSNDRVTPTATLDRVIDSGASSNSYDGTGAIDVVKDYPWTLSKHKDRDDIPQIILHEHRNDESAILRQIAFYGTGAIGQALNFDWGSLAYNVGNLATFGGVGFLDSVFGVSKLIESWKSATSSGDLLTVYDEIFPDRPTGNTYYFPYFTKGFMELSSPQWEQLDDIGASINNMMQGAADLTMALGKGLDSNTLQNAAQLTDWVRQGGIMAKEAAMTGMKFAYPVVGIFDRPRIFASHNEREVTIEFPLYNTIDSGHWEGNRDLIYMLMTQFLYLKNSYITGYPPCYYRVFVPGQYFSFASCVTDFRVTNLGNIRRIGANNVPDAYQISLTLKEMVIPSRNQFEAMLNGEASSRVNVSIS